MGEVVEGVEVVVVAEEKMLFRNLNHLMSNQVMGQDIFSYNDVDKLEVGEVLEGQGVQGVQVDPLDQEVLGNLAYLLVQVTLVLLGSLVLQVVLLVLVVLVGLVQQ